MTTGSFQPKRRHRSAASAMRHAMVFLLAAFLTACSTVQTTQPGLIGIDRKQTMSLFVSEKELNEGARHAYAQVLSEEKKAGKLNTNAALTKRVRRIAKRLIPQAKVFRPDAAKWDWQVNVITSEQLNAWAMPGGKIAFYSGIINKLKLSDAEIAAIMGHEIAHALREHSRERASEQKNSSLLISVLGTFAGLGSTMQQAASIAYNAAFGLTHSRLHETEADRMGVELSARAGYDPRAAISVWRKMDKLAGGKSGPEFLSTHPSAKTRIADLTKYAAKVMPLYKKR